MQKWGEGETGGRHTHRGHRRALTRPLLAAKHEPLERDYCSYIA